MVIPGDTVMSALSILQTYESDSESGRSDNEDDNTEQTASRKYDKRTCICLNHQQDDLLSDVPKKRQRLSQQESSKSSSNVPPDNSTNLDNNQERLDDPISLPKVPMNILQMFSGNENEKVEEDQSQHDGRVRSFPHIRGNWASYIYIHCKENTAIVKELNKLVCDAEKVLAYDATFHLINDKHLSLSRTLPFRHHWIEPFTTNLKRAIGGCQKLDLCFDKFDVFTNDEKTRTFISMKVFGTQTLLDVVEKCNESLADFQLEPYYKNPSFHVSCAWLLGDQSAWVKEQCVPVLNKKWSASMENDPDLQFLTVSTVEFKAGNQLYQFFMQDE